MNYLAAAFAILCITGCQMKKEKADLLVLDATIYTVDKDFSKQEAMAIRDGKILDTGSSASMQEKYKAKKTISLKGKFIYPGLNDAHAHFTGYGLSLNQVDLTGTRSAEDVVDRCMNFAEDFSGTWITGRGWDQNDWEIKEFPGKEILDAAFPGTPVLLRRVDGHAAWANSKALEIAGITSESSIEGGQVRMENGEPSGILIDNAIDLVSSHIPPAGKEEVEAGLLKAQENCFAVGLTSISDAGLPGATVRLIQSMQESGSLKMRLDAWLEPSESNFLEFVEKGIIQTPSLRVGTVKLYADGALGSRGAKMIKDYSDDPGNSGLYLTPPADLEKYCKRALQNGYQVATHCIGDEANRRVLQIYASMLEEGNDNRWRIEHAQVINPEDYSYFGTYNIIPSVQTTHATSDMYWAEERIGAYRMPGAYSYHTLMSQLGWIPNGSDFPVESINPLYGFYAAVSRKDKEGFPPEGFRPEEALSREEALKAMTIWAAKASFQEELKGSLEAGKVADFIVTSEDIMQIEEINIPKVSIEATYLDGKEVYNRSSID